MDLASQGGRWSTAAGLCWPRFSRLLPWKAPNRQQHDLCRSCWFQRVASKCRPHRTGGNQDLRTESSVAYLSMQRCFPGWSFPISSYNSISLWLWRGETTSYNHIWYICNNLIQFIYGYPLKQLQCCGCCQAAPALIDQAPVGQPGHHDGVHNDHLRAVMASRHPPCADEFWALKLHISEVFMGTLMREFLPHGAAFGKGSLNLNGCYGKLWIVCGGARNAGEGQLPIESGTSETAPNRRFALVTAKVTTREWFVQRPFKIFQNVEAKNFCSRLWGSWLWFGGITVN